MELDQILVGLNWRKATKDFDMDKKISESDFEKLLEVLRLAPSSYGLQPWKFIVVRDEKIREKLKLVSYNQPQITGASHLIVLCVQKNIDENYVDHYIETIAKARDIETEKLSSLRKMIVDLLSSKNAAEKIDWATRQVYIALGNLLSVCAMAKIDACPMEGFEAPKYDEILGLDKLGVSVGVVCAVGYRKAGVVGEKKVRFPIEEIIIEK